MPVPQVGIQVFPAEGCVRPVDLGRAVEDRGFDALFFPEHLHMPVERTIDFLLDIPLPEVYKRNLDPFVAFAAIAAVTSGLTLGTAVCLVAQRDPILLAKTVATLDHLCEGRFVLGIGAGWNVEEMQNHGVEPATRWGRAREHVEAMRIIWSEPIASYHGRFVDFERIWSWPKPFADRRIPVLIGGGSSGRVSRWGDGWLPVLEDDLAPLVTEIARVRAVDASQHGDRNLDITVACGYEKRLAAAEFRELADIGVTRILFAVPPLPYAETVEALDEAVHIARDGGWAPPS